MSKRKTINNRFCEAKSTECEYDKPSVPRRSHTTHEWTGACPVIAITNNKGKVVASYTYDAWGVCTIVSDNTGIVASINPFRYRGYYYDQEIGLYYLQSRYYDAKTGRFITADVFTNLGYASFLLSYNLYTYCENLPVKYSDSEGKAILSIIGKMAIGVLAQYAGDIISNIIAGKKGWYVFVPCSTIGEYIAAAITSLFKGGKILKNISSAFVTEVIKAIENAIKRTKEPIYTVLIRFVKNTIVGIIGDYITEAVYSKVMSLSPRNYSTFAHSQYMKNANITPNEIRVKLKNQINLYANTAKAINFLIDSLLAAV